VRVDGVPVTQAARAFGYCRQAFYEVAAALDAGGPSALAAGKPGPKGPLKLTDPVMDQVEGWLAADPDLRSRDLADRVLDVFGFPVHPRSVERAMARRRESRDPQEPKTRP
jgi:transposase